MAQLPSFALKESQFNPHSAMGRGDIIPTERAMTAFGNEIQKRKPPMRATRFLATALVAASLIPAAALAQSGASTTTPPATAAAPAKAATAEKGKSDAAHAKKDVKEQGKSTATPAAKATPK
jgi:hypothetical protein